MPSLSVTLTIAARAKHAGGVRLIDKDDRRLLGTGDKAESARQAALCKRG